MVEFRVWAESRPTHENEVHSAKLIRDLDAIEERELNQGSFDSRNWCCVGVPASMCNTCLSKLYTIPQCAPIRLKF